MRHGLLSIHSHSTILFIKCDSAASSRLIVAGFASASSRYFLYASMFEVLMALIGYSGVAKGLFNGC